MSIVTTIIEKYKESIKNQQEEQNNNETMRRKALQITQMFKAAKNEKEYLDASIAWESVRKDIFENEKNAECSAARELQQNEKLIEDCVGDIAGSAILFIAAFKFLTSYVDQDEEKFLKEGKELLKEIAKEISPDLSKETGKILLKPGMKKQAERILKGLVKSIINKKKGQAIKIIDNLTGLAKGISAPVIITGRIASHIGQIAPEICGCVMGVKKAQQEAMERIYGKGNIGNMI